MSIGSTLLLQAAADEPATKAVVSEGAGGVLDGHVVDRSLNLVHSLAMAVFTDSLRPTPVEDVIADVAPRPIMLVWAPNDGREFSNPGYYERAGEPKTIWEIPESGHTAGWRRDRPSTSNESCSSSTERSSRQSTPPKADAVPPRCGRTEGDGRLDLSRRDNEPRIRLELGIPAQSAELVRSVGIELAGSQGIELERRDLATAQALCSASDHPKVASLSTDGRRVAVPATEAARWRSVDRLWAGHHDLAYAPVGT